MKTLLSTILWPAMLCLALVLRTGSTKLLAPGPFAGIVLLAVPVAFLVMDVLHEWEGPWRQTTLGNVIALSTAIGALSVGFLFLAWFLQRAAPIPRSVPLIAGALTLAVLGGLRGIATLTSSGSAAVPASLNGHRRSTQTRSSASQNGSAGATAPVTFEVVSISDEGFEAEAPRR